MKGASEIVMEACSHYINEKGIVMPLTDDMKGNIKNVITKFAQNALRTISLAYKDVQQGENGVKHDEGVGVKEIEKSGFILISIFGIMDIIRAEVPQAVADV